jgi:hypothetical protein
VNGFLLDTSVISELVKPEPDANVVRWIEDTDESILFLSVIIIGEIRNGIERLARGHVGEDGTPGSRLTYEPACAIASCPWTSLWPSDGVLCPPSQRRTENLFRLLTDCLQPPLCITT